MVSEGVPKWMVAPWAELGHDCREAQCKAGAVGVVAVGASAALGGVDAGADRRISASRARASVVSAVPSIGRSFGSAELGNRR
jgi:hypothetical protein